MSTADTTTNQVVDLAAALATFDEQWAPRNVATVNDYDVRVVHIQGEFVWHSHEDTDELFLLLSGAAEIHLRDRVVTLEPGQLFVVPKGVEHKPVSADGADLLLFEPTGTENTGTATEPLPEHIQTTTGVHL